MRVHQRSCANKPEMPWTETGPSSSHEQFLIPKEPRWRLPCDREAFGSSPIPEESNESLNDGRDDDIYRIISSFLESSEPMANEASEASRLTAEAILILAKMSRTSGRNTVDDLIRVLINSKFPMDMFRSRCSSIRDCIKIEDETISKKLGSSGFRKLTMTDGTEMIHYDIYVRSPIELLQSQIRGSSSRSTFFNYSMNSGNDESYCHPMMAQLGKHGERTVRNIVMSCSEQKVIWHSDQNSTEKSFAGMIQLYSDKSQTSLKESSFQFYPIHLALLNYSEEYRRQCIVKGMTTVAFLPVKFYSIKENNKVEMNISRSKSLEILHRNISIVLKEIKISGLEGFKCKDMEGNLRRCHPCIASYCCDLPESKDILPIKNGNSGRRNCHRCTAETMNFNKFTTCDRRRGGGTVSMISKAKKLREIGKNKEAEEILNEYSLVEFIPFLHEFPFLGEHEVLDIHCIFSFESLHNFHLGISRLLKACMSERLKSETLTTSNVPSKSGNARTATFRTVRMTVLAGVNKMLSHIQRYSPARGLKVDFSKGGASGHEKGLYGAEGNLIGMLEGTDYRSLDIVFPFVGMFVDRCTDEIQTAVSTKLFVLYVEVMQSAMSYDSHMQVTWNEASVIKLEQKIRLFKKKAVELYANFQPSGLCTEKMHLLDHICEDIRRMGGLRSSDASLYEYSHTLVKAAYRSSSKRRNSAMNETVANYVKQTKTDLVDGATPDSGIAGTSKRSVVRDRKLLPSHTEAIQNDCPTLVQTGFNFSLASLEKARKLWRKKRISEACDVDEDVARTKEMLESVDCSLLEMVEDLGETACRVLCREFLEVVRRMSGVFRSENVSTEIVKVSSGYVPGSPAPSKKHYDTEMKHIKLEETRSRIVQRFVCERNFYNSLGLRQDCIMMEAQETTRSGEKLAWFGKLLGLYRVKCKKKSTTSTEEEITDKQMAFVQFFDIAPLEDEVDRALGCVKLVWARGDSSEEVDDDVLQENTEQAQKWFSLVPVESIRAVIHTVRGDYGTSNRCLGVDMEVVPWHLQHFYVNRFYFDSEAKRVVLS